LHAALEQSDKLALAKFVMHQREHIAAIKPVGRALVLNQMRYPTDLREATDLKFPDGKNISEVEVKVALKLISQETAHFVPEDYRDNYTEELEEMIKAKTKGKKVEPRHKAAPTETSAKDLMSALKASLKQD
jgi:DNA end-binding protein Ku